MKSFVVSARLVLIFMSIGLLRTYAIYKLYEILRLRHKKLWTMLGEPTFRSQKSTAAIEWFKKNVYFRKHKCLGDKLISFYADLFLICYVLIAFCLLYSVYKQFQQFKY